MPQPSSSKAIGQQILALVIGTLSGMLAHYFGLPLPWMLGSMIGITIAALSGAPIRPPMRLRTIFLPVIGVMLGAGVSPDIAEAIGRWTVTFALLPLFIVISAAVSYTFYRRIGRYERVTAYFSAMPGGLNDMILLGSAAGGDERKIALAHASRILVVVVFVVMFFGMAMGVSSAGAVRSGVPLDALTLRDWLILSSSAVFGAPLARLLRLPAGQILGPMVLSGLAHVTQLVTVAPPTVIVNIAQIAIGTVIGSRFVGSSLRDIGRDLVLGVGSSILMIGVAVLFSRIVHLLTATELSLAFLAYSPGGLTEMSLLALAMGQEVAYVSVMHVGRLTLVIFAAAPFFRMIQRFRGAAPDGK